MHGDAPAGALPSDATPQPPRILSRVPIDKRGRLYALSVQDHYVEVITDKGSELVLLRLADAMGEVGTTPGLQVHRSHWVATGAVAAAKRDGAKAVLTLQDGRDIPVSRTYLPAVKEAGLLPG
nr:LytTR family DNA-binding domain-containing protein [Maritimibacter sp. DP1N21-5]